MRIRKLVSSLFLVCLMNGIIFGQKDHSFCDLVYEGVSIDWVEYAYFQNGFDLFEYNFIVHESETCVPLFHIQNWPKLCDSLVYL